MSRRSQRGAVPWRRLTVAATAALVLGACGTLSGDREPFRRVRPPVAFQMIFDVPDLPILDLRPPEEYHGPLGHLEGARSFPLADLPRRYLEILELRLETFLVYCDTVACEAEALEFLGSHGFEDVMLIDGGIRDWVDAGFETVGAGAPVEHTDEVAPPQPGGR